ncbi:acyl-CoA thioesterase [Aeromicrobium chenweiae]|uniref:Uncharacterized protein n=1 Tax=Aeromicrobium chenweiae TaxID=2079793 RepID=A0A2S0WJZ7_9ACTN|nr:thioesterase family protein [Aeromicrobium chenweiae]AWB91663.1 hypothetical protein C3E78_05230 [Aeromicrobium chenweiae]TGN32503.1 hypothetical protein E4L97_07190 [Aeromicrobium chenweiae]
MPADEISYELPMRWADLDSLNHVNNVVYLDYAAEARARLVDDGLALDDGAVSSLTVMFLRPMMLSRDPVTVVSTLGEGELTQDICVVKDGERTDFARVVTGLAPRVDATPRPVDAEPMAVRLRRSDLDASGAVRPAKVFELFQEIRVLDVSTRLGWLTPGSFVVGTSRVGFRRPIPWREEPYRAVDWISRVGNASFEIRCEITDGTHVLADSTTTLVGFDLAAQSSRRFGDVERSRLLELVQE